MCFVRELLCGWSQMCPDVLSSQPMSQADNPVSAQTSIKTNTFYFIIFLIGLADQYSTTLYRSKYRDTWREPTFCWVCNFLLIFFFFVFLFFLFIDTALACHGFMEISWCLLSKAGSVDKHRQTVTWAFIIAHNLLLCIAFSKEGSTVYLMVQQKKMVWKHICLSIALLFLAPT